MSDIVNLKEISERFNNGTETIEDIMNYCRNYELHLGSKITMQVVEKKYFDKLVEKIQELEEENKRKDMFVEMAKEVIENSILKQKVKEKIEENNIIMINMQNRHPDIYVLSDEWRNAKAQNKVLEELLEDK